MSVMVIRPERGRDDIHALIDHVLSDGAGCTEADFPDSCRGRFVILTPASLRAYVEKQVLQSMVRPEFRERLEPGMNVGVHSLASMMSSIIGNRDYGRYIRPSISMMSLRNYVAKCLNDNESLRNQVGDSFEAIDQFTKQIVELHNDGVSAEEVLALAAHQSNARLSVLGSLLQLVEQRLGKRYTFPGAAHETICAWAQRHGSNRWFYLYGFAHLNASEMRIVHTLAQYVHLTVMVGAGSDPDYLEALQRRDDGNRNTLSSIFASSASTSVCAMPDTTAEVRYAAASIKKFIADNPEISYGDVLVTSRDLGSYQAQIASEFTYQGIPINIAASSTMLDHPFADAILGLLDSATYELQPQSILRILRSGIFSRYLNLTPTAIDDIENQLNSNNPATVWIDTDIPFAAHLQKIRSLIQQAADVFRPRPSATVREALGGMVGFLTEYAHTIEGSAPVWTVIMNAFDDMVQQLGNDYFAEYVGIFARNLASTLAAQSIDSRPVSASAVDVLPMSSPLHPYRYVIVLGCSESQLPAIPHETGLLDDGERLDLSQFLTSQGKTLEAWNVLSGTVERRSGQEPLWFNGVVASATQQLSMTYPKSLRNAAQACSPYISQWETGTSDTSEIIGASKRAVPTVETEYRPLDRELAYRLFTRPDYVHRVYRTHGADPSISTRVFNASVSAIETYYRNPYEYFLKYGLKVNVANAFAFDAALEGTFYHAVLEHAVNAWIERHKNERDLNGLPPQPTATDMQELIADYSRLDRGCNQWTVLNEDPRMEVLRSSNRMRMIHRQLVDTLMDFAVDAAAQREALSSAQTMLTPTCVEQVFGNVGGTTGAWQSPYSGEQLIGRARDKEIPVALRINGKVDRIDTVIRDTNISRESAGIVVLDYKSSARTLFGKPSRNDGGRASNVYYGHELQLFTYASAAQHNSGMPVAGMFFLPIKPSATIRERIALNNQYNMLPSADDGSTSLFDEPSDDSSAQNMRIRNVWRGFDMPNSGVLIGESDETGIGIEQLSAEEFRGIADYVHGKIVGACQNILDGKLPVRPYRSLVDGRDGLAYSDVADIMAWDVLNSNIFEVETAVTLLELKEAALHMNNISEGGKAW